MQKFSWLSGFLSLFLQQAQLLATVLIILSIIKSASLHSLRKNYSCISFPLWCNFIDTTKAIKHITQTYQKNTSSIFQDLNVRATYSAEPPNTAFATA